MKRCSQISSVRWWRVMGLLAWATLAAGCGTTRTAAMRTVDEGFLTHPAAHQRVQILAVWFEGAGQVGPTLSTNEMDRLGRQVADNLSAAVRQVLGSKNYEIVGPVGFLSERSLAPAPGPELLEQLASLRVDLCDNLQREYPSASAGRPLTFGTNLPVTFLEFMSGHDPGEEVPNPFHYRLGPALGRVLDQLGVTNAPAVLLLDTKVCIESRHNRNQRYLWNCTGGGLVMVTEIGLNAAMWAVAILGGANSAPPVVWVDPFWRSEDSIQHTVALVDVRSRDVLWLNRMSFKHKNPRDPEVLETTLTETTADLPDQTKW